jgi:predicted HTH domain antitoxin
MIVNVPESIANLLPNDPNNRTRAVLEAIVLRAYGMGMVSRGRVCELLGLNYWEGEKFFSERGVPVNYDLAEFQRDLGN